MNDRKPPSKVLSISRDVVTDEDHQMAVTLQAASLQARNAELQYLGIIRQRLANGAVDAGRRWYYDAELGIVRRRDKATG